MVGLLVRWVVEVLRAGGWWRWSVGEVAFVDVIWECLMGMEKVMRLEELLEMFAAMDSEVDEGTAIETSVLDLLIVLEMAALSDVPLA